MVSTLEWRDPTEVNYISTPTTFAGCELLQLANLTKSTDNLDLISDELELLIYRIKSSICIPILFLVGFPANCINMAVFVKQGIRERINLCLFSLSLVDLSLIIFVFIFNSDAVFADFIRTERFGVVYRYIIDTNITGFYGLLHGSMVLSAIIACERCFCILFPLKSQHLLKTRTMTIIIIFFVSSVCLFRFLGTAKYRMVCLFDPLKGQRSYLLGVTVFYLANKMVVDIIDSTVIGLGVSVGCPFVVFIATVITSVKLRLIITWRKSASSAVIMKEVAVTKMLIFLSVQFLVLSIPIICIRLPSSLLSDLNAAGRYKNTFQVLLNVIEVCAYANSALNFIVYYFTGTKYRQTLNILLLSSRGKITKMMRNCCCYFLGALIQ